MGKLTRRERDELVSKLISSPLQSWTESEHGYRANFQGFNFEVLRESCNDPPCPPYELRVADEKGSHLLTINEDEDPRVKKIYEEIQSYYRQIEEKKKRDSLKKLRKGLCK